MPEAGKYSMLSIDLPNVTLRNYCHTIFIAYLTQRMYGSLFIIFQNSRTQYMFSLKPYINITVQLELQFDFKHETILIKMF